MTRRKRIKTGMPPGSIVFSGQRKVSNVSVHYLEYDSNELKESVVSPGDFVEFHSPNESVMQWYDVRGLHDVELIDRIGKTCSIHPLVLEDIASTNQRPKFEEYANGIFISLRSLDYNREKKELETEQVSIYIAKGIILSFQEREEDLFFKIRERLHSGKGRIRGAGVDYLAYTLMDNIVDHYFTTLDDLQEEIEILENAVSNDPEEGIKGEILRLKQEFIKVRKAIFPLREALGQFARCDSEILSPETHVYLRDVYDHTIQVMDVVDTSRDILGGLQDLYISEISFRMNKVMQFLAVITTIFVPLSFLAGLYGMNFKFIPELEYRYGYFILISVMALILVGLLFYFKKKKWF